jgi:nitroimidazol reductase NimA-like FMN-containing flavoprotein (pyridoxamine 5'-phosphate oxidase superfamily)
LYVHGSVASRSLLTAPEQEVSVTVTVIDGLVLARSAFHHSMNYRSAVVMGRPRLVTDPEERRRALDLVVDQVVPGRSATLRAHTHKELAATAVVALPLHEASVKARSGDPVDEERDVRAGGWAGVVPLRLVADRPVTAADAGGEVVPADVLARAEDLGAPQAEAPGIASRGDGPRAVDGSPVV